MSNDQINTVYYNRTKNNFHEICRLAIRKSNKDLYFIDKSNSSFHISIHKDGKVFISPQSNDKKFESILLLKFDWNDIDKQAEFEKPFLFFLPTNVINYPRISIDEVKGLRVIPDNRNPNNLLIKYFLISEKTTKVLARKSDANFQIYKVDQKLETGEIVDYSVNIFPPVLEYNKHKIRYDIDTLNYTIDSAREYRFLYLCQPSAEINIVEFISENTFYFDSGVIKDIGFQIKNYRYKDSDIVMIAY